MSDTMRQAGNLGCFHARLPAFCFCSGPKLVPVSEQREQSAVSAMHILRMRRKDGASALLDGWRRIFGCRKALAAEDPVLHAARHPEHDDAGPDDRPSMGLRPLLHAHSGGVFRSIPKKRNRLVEITKV